MEKLLELYETEKSYVRHLEQIKMYKNYIKNGENSIPEGLKDGKEDLLFVNVDELLDFHQNFVLPILKNSLDNPLELGRIFDRRKIEDFKGLYGKYSACVNKFSGILAEFRHFFQEVHYKLKDQVQTPLVFLLQTPIQVIQYKNILKDMEKGLRKNGKLPEAEMVAKCRKVVDEICKYVDDMIEVGYIINFEVNYFLFMPRSNLFIPG